MRIIKTQNKVFDWFLKRNCLLSRFTWWRATCRKSSIISTTNITQRTSNRIDTITTNLGLWIIAYTNRKPSTASNGYIAQGSQTMRKRVWAANLRRWIVAVVVVLSHLARRHWGRATTSSIVTTMTVTGGGAVSVDFTRLITVCLLGREKCTGQEGDNESDCGVVGRHIVWRSLRDLFGQVWKLGIGLLGCQTSIDIPVKLSQAWEHGTLGLVLLAVTSHINVAMLAVE